MSETITIASRMPLLMPDDFSELHLCAWRVELGNPDPNNPLIEGDMPWDRGGVGDHSSVFKDPLDGRWKAYLECTPAEEFPEKQPENRGKPWASENHAYRRISLFESDDGVHWSRPQLSNVSFEDHPTTNLIFDIDEGTSGYASILIDPENEAFPYEMRVLRESWLPDWPTTPEGNGYYLYRSRDGRSWHREGGRMPEPTGFDICFFYRVGGPLTPFAVAPRESHPETKYVAYYREVGEVQPTDHRPMYEDCYRRTVYRATSVDGQKWTKDEQMILTCDERDHRDTQYQECIPLKVPGGYIAMVSMYHPITQTSNLRMAVSRDASRWWFPDRRACLDNGSLGDYGGGQMWQSQYLIAEDEKLHVYYGATESLHRQISDTRAPSVVVNYLETVIDHGAHFLPFTAALCRSSWRLDRLYALASTAGGPTIGVATTHAQPLGGNGMSVNLRTRPPKKSARPGVDEGVLQIELLDESDKALAGFTREDCAPLKGDHAKLRVIWKGGRVAPEAARKARFYLKRAFLYGYSFEPPQ